MTILEIAVYAALLGGAAPVSCHLDEAAVARCSNGLDGRQVSRSVVDFSNGVTVERRDGEFPVFSNGMKSWWGGAGWLQFSNGIGVRRINGSVFAFSNGLVCTTELPEFINCTQPKEAQGSAAPAER